MLSSTQVLFSLGLMSSNIFWKALVIVALFSKGITHAYLLKISITHNKNKNSFIKFIYQLHICYIDSPKIVYKRWAYVS